MIKRIGILTFHASHNYGSMLQAYAMQTYLKKRGIEAENINLRTNIEKRGKKGNKEQNVKKH